MPRMKRGLRSEAIREYLMTNPKATPKRIFAALKEMGIQVTLGLASSIKYGGMRRKRRAQTVRGVARHTKNGSLTIEHLFAVKRVSASLGGLEQIRLALEALEQLQ